jgi:CubicO group peptidase (beta-lactamase class C family)
LTAKICKIIILGLLLETLVSCGAAYKDTPTAATLTGTVSAALSTSLPIPETGNNLSAASTSGTSRSNPSFQTVQTIRNNLDAYLTTLGSNGLFSGTVLVLQNDQVLFSNSYGYADSEQKLKSSWYNIFPLGGITKQFTAAAILILEQEGKLKVEDPLCHYLPECPPDWQAITLHHVLTHTAGLPAEYRGAANPTRMYKDQDELGIALRELSYKRLEAPPGQKYLYSDFGYNLLGYVIERVSKKSYATFVDEKIFTPLGMQLSSVGKIPATYSGYAIGYLSFGKPLVPNPEPEDAANGIYSSAGDLYRWDLSLYTNLILSPESLNKMFTGQVEIAPFSDKKEAYGYGWIVDKSGKRLRYYHTVSLPGFSGIFVRYPQEKISLLILSNLQTVDSRLLSSTLITSVLEQQP